MIPARLIWAGWVLLVSVVLVAIGAPELLLGIMAILLAISFPVNEAGLTRLAQDTFNREFAAQMEQEPR